MIRHGQLVQFIKTGRKKIHESFSILLRHCEISSALQILFMFRPVCDNLAVHGHSPYRNTDLNVLLALAHFFEAEKLTHPMNAYSASKTTLFMGVAPRVDARNRCACKSLVMWKLPLATPVKPVSKIVLILRLKVTRTCQ